jgi:hypothetical protein
MESNILSSIKYRPSPLTRVVGISFALHSLLMVLGSTPRRRAASCVEISICLLLCWRESLDIFHFSRYVSDSRSLACSQAAHGLTMLRQSPLPLFLGLPGEPGLLVRSLRSSGVRDSKRFASLRLRASFSFSVLRRQDLRCFCFSGICVEGRFSWNGTESNS